MRIYVDKMNVADVYTGFKVKGCFVIFHHCKICSNPSSKYPYMYSASGVCSQKILDVIIL